MDYYKTTCDSCLTSFEYELSDVWKEEGEYKVECPACAEENVLYEEFSDEQIENAKAEA